MNTNNLTGARIGNEWLGDRPHYPPLRTRRRFLHQKVFLQVATVDDSLEASRQTTFVGSLVQSWCYISTIKTHDVSNRYLYYEDGVFTSGDLSGRYVQLTSL